MPFASGDFRATNRKSSGAMEEVNKELLLVDVAAKNLLERLVATTVAVPLVFFPPTPDEFST
jgi:hypothetical protein